MTYIAGSLLVHAGLIRREQLVEAETLRQRDGGTLGECLARLGVVAEEQLVEFYHRRLMVPRIRDGQLERIPARVLSVMTADMAAEFRAVPVELDREGAITLAMADPADTHTVDELSFFTGRFLERAVASESAIRQAIERHYGVRFKSPPASARVELLRARSTPRPPPPPGDAEPVVLLTRVKRTLDVTPLPAPAPMASDDLPADDEPIPLTRKKALGHKRRRTTLTGIPRVLPDPPLAGLRSAADPEAVATLLLDYLARLAPRAAIFTLRRGELRGHDARGEGLSRDSVGEIVLPAEGGSLFGDVIRSRLPYRGPLPEAPANRLIARRLGHLGADVPEVLVFPIAARDRVVALLWAEGYSGALPDQALHAAGREAGIAYERLGPGEPLGS